MAALTKSVDNLLGQPLDGMRADLAALGIHTEFLQQQLAELSESLSELKRNLAAQAIRQGGVLEFLV